MEEENSANSRQKPKKAGRKIRKAKLTKSQQIKRIPIRPWIKWSQTEKIEHLWSNLKYATSQSEIFNWKSHKHNFFPKIKNYMQDFILPKSKSAQQIKDRDKFLKKKFYLAEKSKKKKVDLLDHSYIMVKKYFECAKRNKIKDRDMVRRLQRFETVLQSY